MNILLIHNYYKQRGGEDAVFENEEKALIEKGHNVITYTRNNNEIDNYNIFKKIKFIFNCFYNFKTVKDIKRIIKNNNIQIVHVHNVFPLITPVVYKLLKKHGIRIIQTIHNYRFLCPNGLFYTKNNICTRCVKGNYFNCIKYKCYKDSLLFSALYAFMVMLNQKNFKQRIDGYIALTDFTKNLFINSGYNKDKIFIKDNGFADKQNNIKKSKGYFLYLARLSREKGVDFILESFARIKSYNIVVAGDGDNLEYYKNKYEYENIKFVGFVDEIKKKNLLENAEALIVPSVWYENYPVSIIEAFSYGLPVIASDIGGIPFIIKNNENGLLFQPNNFESLFEVLSGYYKNNKFRIKLGKNAKGTFLKRMDFNFNIKTLLDIYKNVIDKKVNIGGILFDNVNMQEAIELIENKIKSHKNKSTSFVCLGNQDIISKSRIIKGLSPDYVNKAFLMLPDGYSIVYASKLLGNSLKDRVAGPDLIYNFMKVSNEKKYTNFFLGAKDGIAKKMADNFLQQFPKIKIAGIYSPPFGEFSKAENAKMIKMINQSGTDVLWVSFGCPKQEKWILDNMDKINVPLSIGVGAAFDFHSGNLKRAPLVFQKTRLEWLYRLFQEPKRLWKRYLIGGLKFAAIIIKQKFEKL